MKPFHYRHEQGRKIHATEKKTVSTGAIFSHAVQQLLNHRWPTS
jgi:hypothetical protein